MQYDIRAEELETENKEVELPDLMHGYRVGELAIKIAKALGLSYGEITDLYIAGIFHDIGKCGINRAIKNKPGKLTSVEKHIMNNHVRIGATIAMKMKLSKESIRFILGHHESYDGSGYPTGSRGDDIPLGARILKICDCYDALCMDRPYRKAYSLEEVFEIMDGEKHTFDPKLYEIFKGVVTGEYIS